MRKEIEVFKIILLSFLILAFIGSLLLFLPFSTKGSIKVSYIDALFTSFSSVCVTGLTTVNTALTWSLFGQIVILILIQIGGLGVVVVSSILSLIVGRKLGLFSRKMISTSLSSSSLSGNIRLLKFCIAFSFIIEALGAIFLIFPFCKEYGSIGIWYAIFHSISAFCNAGFDILGNSLVPFKNNIYLNIVIMILIITGGLGFVFWMDLKTNKLHYKKYTLQSKVILCTTLVLILIPFLLFFFFEFFSYDTTLKNKILYSLFSSVTPRTAGFNSLEYSSFTDRGKVLTIILMLIGGSPGSTAGGMKTTTIAILFLVLLSVVKRRDNINVFKRRISDDILRNAVSIFLLYISLFLLSGFLISIIEKVSLLDSLFESASAIGTVGLSTGLTSTLSTFSKIILIFLMYIGRVGGLNIIYGSFKEKVSSGKYPEESISVG